MKFEYDKRDDRGECVAYIDGDGDLVIRESVNYGDDNPCFMLNGDVGLIDWMPENSTHKFYPGDKLTITF